MNFPRLFINSFVPYLTFPDFSDLVVVLTSTKFTAGKSSRTSINFITKRLRQRGWWTRQLPVVSSRRLLVQRTGSTADCRSWDGLRRDYVKWPTAGQQTDKLRWQLLRCWTGSHRGACLSCRHTGNKKWKYK